MRKIIKNNNLLAIIISCIIICILFGSSSFFRVLNKSIQNKYYDVKSNIIGLTANPHIIIVEIDEQSFDDIGTFPFPRSVYASALNNLASYNIATIALDILFLDPSTPEEDSIFSNAIESTPNIVLGSSVSSDGKIQTPFAYLNPSMYTTGFLPPNIESSNNTVYSYTPLLKDHAGSLYEHFSIKILRSFYKYYGYDDVNEIGEYTESHYLFSDTRSFPLAGRSSREILINFIPPDMFTRISFSEIYDPIRLQELSKKIKLQDAIILVGPAADGLKDEFFTPNGVEYGVNIHANILNTLLQEEYTMYFNKNLEWMLIFFLIIISVYVNLSPSNKVLVISNMLIVIIFWFIFPLSVLLGTNLIINFPSEIIFSLLLAFTSGNIVKYLIEDKNKRRLNQALSEYVGSNIADEILLEHGKVNLDGQEKSLVCLFSDIQGFTTMSETLTPIDLVAFLRDYLSSMTSIIMDKNGHIDKYEGDAVMALWGAFTDHTNADYLLACQSALLQTTALTQLNERWYDKLGTNIKVRIGIHGGKSIIGNIGALGRKMEFTALGDNINLASRLESVNKYYGTYICVSEVVYKATQDNFDFRYLDEIQVKGKDEAVKIYELIGEKDTITCSERKIYDTFIVATKLYKERKFQDALLIFKKLELEGDTVSKLFVKRCQQYIENPPAENWDGIWRMLEK